MESDEHRKVPEESDTWNTGKSNENPWDNTDALQDSQVNSATRNNNAQDGSWDKVVAIKDPDSQQDSRSNVTIQKNDARNDSWDNVADKAPNSAAEDSWGNLTDVLHERMLYARQVANWHNNVQYPGSSILLMLSNLEWFVT